MNTTLPTKTTPDSGTGTPSNPLVFSVPVSNQNLLPVGLYTGLVKVTDTRLPGTSTIGGENDTLVHTIDGIQTQWFEMNEFATYQTFTATVVVGCGPITGQITQPSQNPVTGVASGSNITFTATASSANGGDPVVLYEWDMDYDNNPAHFNVDGTGSNVILGPFINPNCPIPNPPKTYRVAVRATDSCTPPNVTIFDTVDIVVDLCVPPSVGNITLKVNRMDVSLRWQINAGAPFTLDWTALGGIPEYAIYVDTNPDDGLTNSLAPTGTTTTNTWTESPTALPANHYIKGWTYIVRARTIAGDPSSEGIDSEPAFVTFNGWETIGSRTNPGISNTGEGWMVHHELANTHFMSWPNTYSDGYQSQGTYCMWYTPFCNTYQGSSYSGNWQGMTKQTPSVPNSTVRFLEFSGRVWQIQWNAGVFIGTINYQPFHNFTTTTDIEWASVLNTPPYHGYNTNSSDIAAWASGIPAGQNNAWADPNWNETYWLLGGDVNIDGDPSDQYIAIELVNIQSSQPYFMMDEVAIAIY